MQAGEKRQRKSKLKKGASWFGCGLMYFVLYIPIAVMIVYSFNKQQQNMMWEGFTVAWYGRLFRDRELMKVFQNTMIVSCSSTVISVIIGAIAAYGISRFQFKGKNLLMNILYIPIVIPEIVMGVSLLIVYMGVHLPLNLFAMILAHVTFCAPFVIITIRGRIGGMGLSEEEASMDLGANRRVTFLRVTLPMMAPAIMAGAFMAFTLSFDDLVVSNFVAGPNSTTLPIKVQSMLKVGVTPEINALSTLIFAVLLTAGILAKLVSFALKKRAAKKEELLIAETRKSSGKADQLIAEAGG